MSELYPFIPATPESQGVPSSILTSFIKGLLELRVNFHSIIVVRHGRVLTEAYFSPFDKNTLRPGFSQTKSFVAMAVGLMADEGKLSLDDCVADYFPEFVNENTHPLIMRTTIRDLLKMSDCHEEDTHWIEARKYLFEKDWVKSWFETKPSHLPGKIFMYNSTCSYMLGAVVEKIAGMPFLDYMRPRVLDHIGFSPDAYCMTSPDGYSAGASGLVCTARDIVRLASLCLDKGMYDGKQLISEDYVTEATSYQIDNQITSLITDSEHRYGYGYQIWCTRHGGFAFVGVLGQLAVCLPKQGLIVAVTGFIREDEAVMPGVYSAVWDRLLPGISDNALPENPAELASLRELTDSLTLIPVSGKESSPMADIISGVWYEFTENDTGLLKVCVEFDGDTGTLTCVGTEGEHRLEFGIAHTVSLKIPDTSLILSGSAAWIDKNTLDLTFSTIGGKWYHHFSIVMSFSEKDITVWMGRGSRPYMPPYGGFASGSMI